MLPAAGIGPLAWLASLFTFLKVILTEEGFLLFISACVGVELLIIYLLKLEEGKGFEPSIRFAVPTL
jgi:hypothetical protein